MNFDFFLKFFSADSLLFIWDCFEMSFLVFFVLFYIYITLVYIIFIKKSHSFSQKKKLVFPNSIIPKTHNKLLIFYFFRDSRSIETCSIWIFFIKILFIYSICLYIKNISFWKHFRVLYVPMDDIFLIILCFRIRRGTFFLFYAKNIKF